MRLVVDAEKTGGQSLGPTASAVPPNARHGEAQSNIVDFEGPDDPTHPLNWSRNEKLLTTALYSLTTMSTPFAGAIYSPAMDDIATEFNVSKEAVTVGLSLCLLQCVFFSLELELRLGRMALSDAVCLVLTWLNYRVGPLIWAPLSGKHRNLMQA